MFIWKHEAHVCLLSWSNNSLVHGSYLLIIVKWSTQVSKVMIKEGKNNKNKWTNLTFRKGMEVRWRDLVIVLFFISPFEKNGTIGCLILLHDNLFQSLRESFHNLPASKGIQPLHWVISYGQPEIVKSFVALPFFFVFFYFPSPSFLFLTYLTYL